MFRRILRIKKFLGFPIYFFVSMLLDTIKIIYYFRVSALYDGNVISYSSILVILNFRFILQKG